MPIDDTTERPSSLLPTEPLEVHGMRAGISEHDHGPFRAAATVTPADLTASEMLEVPAGDIVHCPRPLPELRSDVVYASVTTADDDALELRADVLIPAGAEAGRRPLPIVIFVPGGGFVLSPKSGALIRRTAIAQRGFVVVSIEYRTLRHGTYRDGVADVATAVEWVRSHAAEFGGDPSRCALWGESAGGYLSAMAVTTRAVDGLACVVDVFGLTDLSQVAMDFDLDEQARHLTADITEAKYVFGRHSGTTIVDDPDSVLQANPVRHVGGHEPPFLLMHGEIDGLVSPGQSQLLHRALLDTGVDSRRVLVRGAGHYGMEWCSSTVLDLIADHLLTHLGGRR